MEQSASQNRDFEQFDEELYAEGFYINTKLTIYALALVVMMMAHGSLNLAFSVFM